MPKLSSNVFLTQGKGATHHPLALPITQKLIRKATSLHLGKDTHRTFAEMQDHLHYGHGEAYSVFGGQGKGSLNMDRTQMDKLHRSHHMRELKQKISLLTQKGRDQKAVDEWLSGKSGYRTVRTH